MNKEYREIEPIEYSNNIKNHIIYSNTDLLIISNIFKEFSIRKMNYSTVRRQVIILSCDSCEIFVTKLVDDYFLVRISSIYNRKSFEDYFICDQISGIRSLYNDVISKYK